MIKEKKIDLINEYLATWRGAMVEFNQFRTSMGNLFGIALYKAGKESIGLQFSVCMYIQGPTAWKNADLKCRGIKYDNSDCFEVTDEKSGFKVIAASGITAGDGELQVAVND